MHILTTALIHAPPLSLSARALKQRPAAIMGLLTKLVHNDAIKQDPKEIYGWRVYALACSVCTTVPNMSEL